MDRRTGRKQEQIEGGGRSGGRKKCEHVDQWMEGKKE